MWKRQKRGKKFKLCFFNTFSCHFRFRVKRLQFCHFLKLKADENSQINLTFQRLNCLKKSQLNCLTKAGKLVTQWRVDSLYFQVNLVLDYKNLWKKRQIVVMCYPKKVYVTRKEVLLKRNFVTLSIFYCYWEVKLLQFGQPTV